jgi:hypothetical protein
MPSSAVNRLSIAAVCGIAVFLATPTNRCSASGEPPAPPPQQAESHAAAGGGVDAAAPAPASDGGGIIRSDGFLSNGYRDWLAIIGVVGVLLTALGVWWSWRSVKLAARQLQQTRAVNEALTTAAIQALEASRKQYDKHLLTQVQTHLEAAKIYVESEKWELASLRVRDLAHAFAQLEMGDGDWRKLGDSLPEMEETLVRVARDEIKFSKSLNTKWRALCRQISTSIAERSNPFPLPDEEQAHGPRG